MLAGRTPAGAGKTGPGVGRMVGRGGSGQGRTEMGEDE